MRKILIIGNDIHAYRYRDVLIFRDDCEIYFNCFDIDINEYDYVIFSEPYKFDVNWCLKLSDYKNVLILEKCQFDFDNIDLLDCKVYYVHLRDFNKKIIDLELGKINGVRWPNLSNQGMDKLFHTLPNVLDALFNLLKTDCEVNLMNCNKEKDSLNIKISISEKIFDIIIYDVQEFGVAPIINGIDIAWPNFFESINGLVDYLFSDKVDYLCSRNREKKYCKFIRKVEKIMDLMNLVYTYNKNIIYKNSNDMLMAYNQDNGDMYEFNSVGAEIFIMISKEIPLKEMFEELTKKYNVSNEEIYDDVKELIDRLIELKVIILN